MHVETPQSICRFGIAVGDITPPVGIYHRMWGAATHERAEGIHRPLRATVLIFQPLDGDGGEDARQVLVALDHCLLGPPEMDLLLGAVTGATGVPRDDIVVVFSHTHAAGLMSLDRQELPGGDLIRPYLWDVAERVSELVLAAQSSLSPATIVFGTGRCDLAQHRDYWDGERKQFVCGYNPHETADDTVVAARVTGDDGRLLATIVNYACHPTTLAWENRLISPDYPAAMREVVEQATGAPCVFVQGASGDLGPKEGYVGDPAVADRNGRQLGYAALATLTALPPPATQFEYAGAVVSGATLGAWRHAPVSPAQRERLSRWQRIRWTLSLPYRPGLSTREQVQSELARWEAKEAAARSAGNDEQARDCRAMVERQTRMLMRLAVLPPGNEYPLDLTLWRTGDAFWVTVPGEPYSLLQRSLRARFPDTPIVVSNLANGWGPSYLPTEDVYDKGIYQESIAVAAPGSLEKIIADVARHIERMR